MNEDKIIKALLKKAWLIILFTVVCTLATIAYCNISIQPKYQAKTTMYVMARNNSSINTNITTENINVSQYLVKDYSELIKSDKVVSAVMEKLGVTELTSEVSISAIGETNLLQLSVIDPNPEKAKDVANMFAQVFIEKILGITNQNDISVVDQAKLPDKTVSTAKAKIVISVFLASFLLISGLVVILKQLDNRIESIEDIEKEVGYTVIGVIPELNIK